MKAEEKSFDFKISTEKLRGILIKATSLRVNFENKRGFSCSVFFPDSIRKSKGTLS